MTNPRQHVCRITSWLRGRCRSPVIPAAELIPPIRARGSAPASQRLVSDGLSFRKRRRHNAPCARRAPPRYGDSARGPTPLRPNSARGHDTRWTQEARSDLTFLWFEVLEIYPNLSISGPMEWRASEDITTGNANNSRKVESNCNDGALSYSNILVKYVMRSPATIYRGSIQAKELISLIQARTCSEFHRNYRLVSDTL